MSINWAKRVFLGTYLVVLAGAVVLALFVLWPVEKDDGTWEPTLRWPWSVEEPARSDGEIPDRSVVSGFRIDVNVRLLLLVACLGALGSFVHAATSFASYAGNETLRFSWMWWYFLRPWIGMALALIVYFVLRGGFLSGSSTGQDVSVYGVVAVAGLVGMFSKQATDKLNGVFKNLFRTSRGEGDAARRDKLDQKQPVDQVMIRLEKIEKICLDSNRTVADITTADLMKMLGPAVSRIPVFDESSRVQFVIHESQVYRFVAHSVQKVPGFDINTATLADLLSWENVGKLVRAMAFVDMKATLADAKRAMDNVDHCRDVFVTQSGKEDEPVLGWLTNIDIGKRMGGS